MATYTAFISTPRVESEDTYTPEGITAYVSAQVTVLDASNTPVGPYGLSNTDSGWSSFTLAIRTPRPTVNDTVQSLRARIVAGIRDSWAPTITATDILKPVFLDGTALINVGL